MKHISGFGLAALLITITLSMVIYLNLPTSAGSSIGQEAQSLHSTKNLPPDKLLNNWKKTVTGHIYRFNYYPAEARKLKQQGVVKVTFTVNDIGEVIANQVAESSGFADLDNNALEIINRASPFPWPPRQLLKDGQITLTVPINYAIGRD